MKDNSAKRLAILRAELERLHENPTKEAIRDLEEKARTLRRDAISGDLEDETREFLREVSNFRRQQSNNSNIEDDLRAAETRIVSGSIADLRDAVRRLDHVLHQEPENARAYRLLARVTEKSVTPQDMVVEVLRSINSEQATRLLGDLDQSSLGGSVSDLPEKEVERLQRRMIDMHYQGDYKETVKICVAILNLDPRNGPAKEYQVKAEDYIQRGVVPDHRIPLDARISFNRGVSSMRAGSYEQARELFEDAICTARVEGGIERWMDAENALLEIENLTMAKDLRSEGDNLAQNDQWEEALEKYKEALALVDEPRSRGKYEAMKNVLQLYQQIGVQLELLNGRLVNQAQDLQDLRKTLREAREHLPESTKLSRLAALMDSRATKINDELREQVKKGYRQAKCAHAIEERIRLLDRASTHLAYMQIATIADEDIRINVDKSLEQSRIARQKFDKVARLLAPPIEEGNLNAIKLFLDQLRFYILDWDYQRILNTYLYECLARCERAQSNPDWEEDWEADWEAAEKWLQKAESTHDFVFCAIEFAVLEENDVVQNLKATLQEGIKRQKIRLFFNRGKALAKKGQYERAIELFEEILVAEPDNALFQLQHSRARSNREKNQRLWSYIVRGQATYEAGDAKTAVEAFANALDLKPDDPQLIEQYQATLELLHIQNHGWRSLPLKQKIKLLSQTGLALVLLVVAVFILSRVLFS